MICVLESAENLVWHLFIDEKLGEICNDNERRTFENKLSLTNCLKWCRIYQRAKFCMWKFSNGYEQTGDCTAANQCENRTTMHNENHRIYVQRM